MSQIQIPNNIILKSLYTKTLPLLSPNYINDIVENITEYILNTDPIYYRNIEIESKLGYFEFLGEKSKIFSLINETFKLPDIKSKDFLYNFKATISPSNFFAIWNAIERESYIKNSGIIRIEPLNIVDKINYDGIRLSKIYKEGEFIKKEIIKKEDKVNFNVRNYGNDFRITCSKEIETDFNENDSFRLTRDKFRVSYQFSFFQIDLTISKNSLEPDNYCYEVEIEIKNLDKLIGKNNNWKFDLKRVLVRFIENILNLYTAILPDCYNLISQEENFKNCYGDYLQNNIK
jgi:hypothetical protein